ncbi:MAG: hypothetical protein JWR77_2350 [Rhizorhabdus sp.]|nr:hypothetical protein [Rhizorhabdus sp.]
MSDAKLAGAARELAESAVPLRRWAEKDLRNERSRVAAMEQADEPGRLAIERFDAAIAALDAAIGEAR